MSEENGKVCCSCRHNIRTPKRTYIACHCDIDGHYIGYIECMTHWCRRWARDRKWDEDEQIKAHPRHNGKSTMATENLVKKMWKMVNEDE